LLNSLDIIFGEGKIAILFESLELIRLKNANKVVLKKLNAKVSTRKNEKQFSIISMSVMMRVV